MLTNCLFRDEAERQSWYAGMEALEARARKEKLNPSNLTRENAVHFRLRGFIRRTDDQVAQVGGATT